MEIGPPLRVAGGRYRGDGAISDPAQVDAIFEAIDALPIVDQVRLSNSRFSGALLEDDLDGDSINEEFFLTIDFPTGRYVRERANPLSGVEERLVYQDGLWIRSIDDRRILELEYDGDQVEASSRLYANAGSRIRPVLGKLIEETKTVEFWHRDPGAAAPDPGRAVLAKYRVNYVTGRTTRELFGMYPRPIETVDSQFISRFDYNAHGILVSGEVYENGASPADHERTLVGRLDDPREGEKRYELTVAPGILDPEALRNRGFLLLGEQRDLLKKTSRRVEFDLAKGGRITRILSEDPVGGRGLEIESVHHYRDDFQHGQIPDTTLIRVVGSDLVLETLKTESYDALGQQLITRSTDYTGRELVKTWSSQWESPIAIASEVRRTDIKFDRRGMSFASTTVSVESDEVVFASEGQYDVENELWKITRRCWFAPEIPLPDETLTLSPGGRVLSHEVPGSQAGFEYTEDGSVSSISSRRAGALIRLEDEFAWEAGARTARVRTFLDGQPYDEFRTVSDPEGRLVVDGIRNDEAIGLRLETKLEYVGATERVARAETWQSGVSRSLFEPGEPQKQPDGGWLLPVTETPSWGNPSTAYFEIGSGTPLPIRTDLVGGARDIITETFSGGMVPRLVRRFDTDGVLIGEVVRGLGDDGRDVVSHYRVGENDRRGLTAMRRVVRGTDITVTSDIDRCRRFFDVSKPYEHPILEIDSAGEKGGHLTVNGESHENVTEVFRVNLDQERGRLQVESVALGGVFSTQVREQEFDLAGRLLRESSRRVPSGTDDPMTLIERGRALAPESMTGYRYGSGGIEPEEIVISGRDGGIRKRLTDPREVPVNPFLPDTDELWKLWSGATLGQDGAVVFREDVYRDSAGRPATTVAYKRNAKGKEVRRISYVIAAPHGIQWDESDEISRNGIGDYSDCHFIACHIRGELGDGVAIEIKDQRGSEAIVSNREDATVGFWPAATRIVQWLPRREDVRQAASVSINPAVGADQTVLIISIPSLRLSGIDVQQITSVKLRGAENCSHSGIVRLCADEQTLAADRQADYSERPVSHTSGIRSSARFPDERGAPEFDQRQRERIHYWSADLDLGSVPFGRIRPRRERSEYPIVIFEDHSDADSPQALYALVAENGEFIERYVSQDKTHSLVHTVAPGFRPAKLELFRQDLVEDELSPSLVGFGEGYRINLPLSRTSNFHNQVASSIFKVAGDTVARAMGREDGSTRVSSPIPSRDLHLASVQAEAIEALPGLAESILPRRPLPWGADALPRAGNPKLFPSLSTGSRRDWFGEQSREVEDGDATPLIKTSPGTASEELVNTVEESDLIRLAIRLNQHRLAAAILDFYWDEAKGGITPLHGSYDRRTGASLEVNPRYKRPSASGRPALAQISVAIAALDFAEATGDRNAWQFGTRLIDLVWAEFRELGPHDGAPAGISESLSTHTIKRAGMTLWPAAPRYECETNCQALLALHRIRALGEKFDPVPEIDLRIREHELWIREAFIDRVDRLGVVPDSLFQIQDLESETEALGVSKWTSAAGWLALLEAADAMGVPRAKTHLWLENLARIHGVTESDLWGLDWSLALSRPDAISPELTADFYRVATLLEHQQAAAFARDQLGQILARSDDRPPAKVITRAVPGRRFPTGQGSSIFPLVDTSGWPATVAPLLAVGDAESAWLVRLPIAERMLARAPAPDPDLGAVISTSARFYISILIVAIFWWTLRFLRLRRHKRKTEPLVDDLVMVAAEERWAKRVMGACSPDGSEHTRFAHGPVEANFLIQLRAIYKLVVEWRRLNLGWAEDDPRLVESDEDAWLNGADEFATIVGLYTRYVIKAGHKDGFAKADELDGDEDSNYLWARLVLYFSEYYWGLLTLVDRHRNASSSHEINESDQQIFLLLNGLGMRNRKTGYDARTHLNYPENPEAFDLMVVQQEGVTLTDLAREAGQKLAIPERQFRRFLRNYKAFKRREDPSPIHPFIFEAAKILPHFVLMTLIGVVWYNNEIGGLPIVPYLSEAISGLLVPRSLLWAVPLVVGYGLSTAAHHIRYLRYEAGMRTAAPGLKGLLPFKGLFEQRAYVLPLIKEGRGWDPPTYARLGYILRGIGFLIVGTELMVLPAPSFAVFLILKGLLATVLLAEAAAIIVPLASTWMSMGIQQRVRKNPQAGRLSRFVDSLNITATRPASIIWLSIAYHYPISVPSGRTSALVRAVVYYFAFAALFLFAGSYVLKEVIGIWFVEAYLMGWDFRILFGGILFFNTMYLMRFGLSVLLTAIGAMVVNFPLRVSAAAAAIAIWIMSLTSPDLHDSLAASPSPIYLMLGVALLVIFFEESILSWVRRCPPFSTVSRRSEADRQREMDEYRADPSRTFGVVYMSGDDLGFQKLNPGLMMERWSVLRDQLGSDSARLLEKFPVAREEANLSQAFGELYEIEERAGVTLWHPMQLVVDGESGTLPETGGLNIGVGSVEERERHLDTWHLRRWIVSMMSTAGHSQDTAVNLIDIAMRLERERLSQRVVFYLIQNKYDDRDDNRPGQVDYSSGELGQREKLAELLTIVAPGSRAYNLNDWTPFGFKAGGMMAMDLVFEESLQITNMLVLDRNATVHDLDALMEDVTTAITDPGVVNVIPGRSTTNTLTPIGQGSQAMEEGHRQLMKGIMLLGGEAGESVGTGWGNLQAIYYGRVQRAMMDAHTRQMPLTTRMVRGSSFSDRLEGMIGFGPHAVGISEDIWAVVQGAHNAIALGYRVKFKRSKAMWHKIRETWSHADWFSAFPRWSGGYLQMMQDPLMQRLNDRGPLSLFAKELRANNGRFYLSAPFALFSILIMPLAILCDASPFVQILIILWNFGFIMNQVLTMLGLMASLEATGFSKSNALGGVGVAACAASWLSLSPLHSAVVVLIGSLAGGFLIGLGRWLLDRGRDIIMFGPQLVIHTLGQVVRQSLEFVLSGSVASDARSVNIAFRAWAGPREDRPWARYGNLVNLRSVVWIVGLLSVALNLFALSKLDFQNVVLLLPSLLFSVSCLLGPFLQSPRPGNSLRGWEWLPKTLGWVVGFVLYTVVAIMVASAGWIEWLAIGILATCFIWMACSGLRYLGFARRLAQARREVTEAIMASGADLDPGTDERLSEQAIQAGVVAQAAVETPLIEAGLEEASANAVAELICERIHPLLESASGAHREGSRGRRRRFTCEFGRSFALSLATFIWFLVVPVPGLLIFTAGQFRIGFGVTPFVWAVAVAIGIALLAAILGRLAERGTRSGMLGRGGLLRRIETIYRRFRAAEDLDDTRTSAVFALFTDTQTYLDQGSYSYVRRTLDNIEEVLEEVPDTLLSPGHPSPHADQ